MSEPQYEPLVSDDELSNMAFRCSGGFNAILHKLTLVRDQCEAKLARAHASLQAMRAGVWQPLPDGLYCADALAIAYDGKDIGIRIDDTYAMDTEDWVNNYEWLSDAHVSGADGNEELRNIRLCRLTDADDGAVRVTSEVREALDILLILTVDMADSLWIYHDGTEMHALGENYRDAARIVKAWRDGLGNNTKN